MHEPTLPKSCRRGLHLLQGRGSAAGFCPPSSTDLDGDRGSAAGSSPTQPRLIRELDLTLRAVLSSPYVWIPRRLSTFYALIIYFLVIDKVPLHRSMMVWLRCLCSRIRSCFCALEIFVLRSAIPNSGIRAVCL